MRPSFRPDGPLPPREIYATPTSRTRRSGPPPAAVVHLAAAPRGGDDPWLALADDLAMAGAVLRAVGRRAPQAPVLFAGSAAQYGMGARRLLTETDPTVPVSAYGAAKCVLERAVTGPLSRRRPRHLRS